MKVFICWSGARSQAIAEALRVFIPDVIQRAECFMSEADIEAGDRWAVRLLQELDATNYGVLCLTPESLNSPWPLFEAGAIAKSLASARVCPYLFGLSKNQVKWPLAQFQAKLSNEEETKALVRSINKSATDGILTDEQLDRTFERFWPDLKRKLDAVPAMVEGASPKRDVEDMVEEILSLLRPHARPQVGGNRPKAVIADGIGGFLDGARLFGDTRSMQPRDAYDPVAFLFLTQNAQIGMRFMTGAPMAMAVLHSGGGVEKVHQEMEKIPEEERSQVYEVVDRFEDDLMIYFKIKHLPGYKPNSSDAAGSGET